MLERMSNKFPFYRKALTSICPIYCIMFKMTCLHLHSITVCCKNILHEADTTESLLIKSFVWSKFSLYLVYVRFMFCADSVYSNVYRPDIL